MDNHNYRIESSSLVNTLTLRYDPSIKPNLPKKTWRDFETINEPPSIESIEKSICNSIEQKLKKFNGKKISIALSGGVDSTLVLSLIRKIKPDIGRVIMAVTNGIGVMPAYEGFLSSQEIEAVAK